MTVGFAPAPVFEADTSNTILSDKDIEFFEDMAMAHVTNGTTLPNGEVELDYGHQLKDCYLKQCKKWFHELWKQTWYKYSHVVKIKRYK